jgi:hypothetical protein
VRRRRSSRPLVALASAIGATLRLVDGVADRGRILDELSVTNVVI